MFILNPNEMNYNYPRYELTTDSIDTNNTTPITTNSSSEASTTSKPGHIKDYAFILIGTSLGLILVVVVITCLCCKMRKGKKSSDELHVQSTTDKYNAEVTTKTKRQRHPDIICPYMKLAKEYVESCKLGEKLFNNQYDACYCERCYPSDKPNFISLSSGLYIIPRGWVRVGIRFDMAFEEEHNIWDDWIVTYHGTKIESVKPIILHKFLLPGDKMMDGTTLSIPDEHIPNKKHIYTTPSIEYASLSTYSRWKQFSSAKRGKVYAVQAVLQCRQNPSCIEIQAETVGAKGRRLCPYIPNNEIEYFTEVRQSIFPYGLLLRFVEKQEF